MLKKSGFTDLAVDMQKITYQFNDMLAALNSIKTIGASYKFSGSHKTLRSKNYFKKLESIYKNICKTEDKIPLRWEVLYFTGKKL